MVRGDQSFLPGNAVSVAAGDKLFGVVNADGQRRLEQQVLGE
jgi:hypothetical protein